MCNSSTLFAGGSCYEVDCHSDPKKNESVLKEWTHRGEIWMSFGNWATITENQIQVGVSTW